MHLCAESCNERLPTMKDCEVVAKSLVATHPFLKQHVRVYSAYLHILNFSAFLENIFVHKVPKHKPLITKDSEVA